MKQTSTITVYDMDKFNAKLAAFNKRAIKAGCLEASFLLLSTETRTVTVNRLGQLLLTPYEVFDHHEVELSFYEVVLPGGWKLEGVIDHAENLVRSVPDSTINLTQFIDNGPVCDHCKKMRLRSETFILSSEDGALSQVGRQCLGLFLGMDAERALSQCQLSSESMVLDEEWTGSPKSKGYNLEDFLTHTACMVRTAGWRSRTTAKDNPGTQATADMVIDNMLWQYRREKDPRTREPLWVDPSAADGTLAKEVIVWLKGDGIRRHARTSDYMANLLQIGENGYCTDKSAGYAASAINAYLKEKETEVKRVEEAKGSGIGQEWLGKEGDKLTVIASKVSSAGFDTNYGYTFIHKFIAAGGYVICWRTQTEVENGQYKLTGTVKKHDEYRGQRQTELTRCKLGLPE